MTSDVFDMGFRSKFWLQRDDWEALPLLCYLTQIVSNLTPVFVSRELAPPTFFNLGTQA